MSITENTKLSFSDFCLVKCVERRMFVHQLAMKKSRRIINEWLRKFQNKNNYTVLLTFSTV